MNTDRIVKPHKIRAAIHSLALGLLMSGSAAWALTAANTVIKNQASASFRDESGQQYSVTSNLVETLVQQVAGVDLVQDQGKRASIGGTVYFPHVLTNVGNGDDQYDLTATDVAAGDNFDFGGGNITFYADLNQDGQPDDLNSPITGTPLLAAEESFAFVAIANVPDTVADGENGQFTIDAQSQFTPAVTAGNTDTVDITNQAIVDVSKSMSATTGTSGSGNYTVTLRYANTSTVDATDLVIIDALPPGMSYVAGSGRWSESGSTVLSDADMLAQPAGSDAITYCAYDTSCNSAPYADSQVTATVSRVGAGMRGEVSFEVSIDAGLPVSQLINIAEQEYNDGSSVVTRTPTNQVIFRITASPGVVTNGSSTVSTDLTDEPITVAGTSQGGVVSFTDYVWNTGNGSDSFDMTLSASNFPAGTALMLYKADGVTPLIDTNGNGIPDTGNLDAGANIPVIIRATLPPGATGSNYEVTLTATSFTDDSLSNPARNILTSITSASADLTNNAALGDSGALGTGAGPEGAALTTNNALPGDTTRFTLYVNNTSANHDNYHLQASTDSSFGTLVLPAGWEVVFVDANDYIINNTGNMAPNTSKLIYADVTVPPDAGVSTTSVYFRILSPNSGAADIKHDAVNVGEFTDLVLEPNNQGQVLPGGAVVYSHWLSNQGNADKSNITLSQTNGSAGDGWSSEIYEDTDGDGVLSGGDTRISTVANISSGASKLLFVKVYAPASVPMGTDNLTTITASWDSGASSTSAEDLTTTNRSDVKITKEQALDADCNGSPDTGTFSMGNFDVEPGQCVIYQLTAINTGAETMHNVRIQDATPAYTHFITTGGLPDLSQGALASAVTHGSEGQVIGNMGSVAAGAAATLIFGIAIE
ncbi:MAG: hypothetical protein ACPGSM_15045 [Thiolinea sp.]